MRLFFLFLSTFFCMTLRAEIYAVIVGVNTYGGAAPDLRSAVRDAQSVYNFFCEKSSKQNVVLLTDKQATKSKIVAKMNEVFARAKKDDVVVFYFSGHGAKGAFCPSDVGEGEGALWHSEVKQAFKKSRAGTKLCIADACFSGSIQSKTSTSSPSTSAGKSNVVIIMSSRPTEISIEQSSLYGVGSGIFTKHLLQALRGAADKNQDRKISVEELYRYLRAAVRKASNQQQTPVLYGNVSAQSILLRY